jgi:hypothetical protein
MSLVPCVSPSCPALFPNPLTQKLTPVNINDRHRDRSPSDVLQLVTVGCFVGHCHTLDHEDIGMMQRFDILPAKCVEPL